MHINSNLKPKRTPGHPMLDEPDDTAELGPSDASTYRSCVGVLLYIAADYVECQYTIRGLSQCMAKPTVRALACLRHLCMYLLGCMDHCIMLSYQAHHGLLHYNELDYTLEVYSDRIGLNTRPQGKVFQRDVCFCLATFFTPLPGVRKLWH